MGYQDCGADLYGDFHIDDEHAFITLATALQAGGMY
jgi:hypothetical protein